MAGSSQIPQYLWRRTPPSPTPNWRRREIRNHRRQKTRRGTPRNATERGGTPKFGNPALDPGEFWRVRPEFPNIVGAGRNLPRRPIGVGRIFDATENKRRASGRRGTLQNAADRPNLANPPWNPSIFDGPLPNFLKLLAPPTPSPTPNWGRCGIRNYRSQQTNRGTPRGATARGGTP